MGTYFSGLSVTEGERSCIFTYGKEQSILSVLGSYSPGEQSLILSPQRVLHHNENTGSKFI
jgi:hypothetical protein